MALTQGDIAAQIALLPNESVDAILHDPPRFGIAGELYSQLFYDHLARVIKRNGGCFTTPARPTNMAVDAMYPTKYRSACGWRDLRRS